MGEILFSLPSEFKPTYAYRVSNGKIVEDKVLEQSIWESTGVVYARSCDGKIVYIGKLSRRIRAYVKGISASETKNKMTAEYRKWAEGKFITIFAYKPPSVTVCGLDVDMHTSLEAALIKKRQLQKGSDPWFVKRI